MGKIRPKDLIQARSTSVIHNMMLMMVLTEQLAESVLLHFFDPVLKSLP